MFIDTTFKVPSSESVQSFFTSSESDWSFAEKYELSSLLSISTTVDEVCTLPVSPCADKDT